METTESAAYTAPVVLDAGDVVEVTLGNQNFDRVDDFSVKSCVLKLDVAARAHPPPPAGPTQHNTSARPLPGDGLKCVRAGIPTRSMALAGIRLCAGITGSPVFLEFEEFVE